MRSPTNKDPATTAMLSLKSLQRLEMRHRFAFLALQYIKVHVWHGQLDCGCRCCLSCCWWHWCWCWCGRWRWCWCWWCCCCCCCCCCRRSCCPSCPCCPCCPCFPCCPCCCCCLRCCVRCCVRCCGCCLSCCCSCFSFFGKIIVFVFASVRAPVLTVVFAFVVPCFVLVAVFLFLLLYCCSLVATDYVQCSRSHPAIARKGHEQP